MSKMVETVSTVNSAIRTILVLAFLVALLLFSWYAYTTYHEQDLKIAQQEDEIRLANAKIGDLELENEEKQLQIDQLSLRLKLLKTDRRVARINVLHQEPSEESNRKQTTFSFVELDEYGTPLSQPHEFTVDGEMVFVNYRVVKFQDELVETNDPLRAASICLIQKIYGEFQQPAEGFTIDEEGQRPEVYGISEEPSEYEKKIWENFWDIANDPIKAEEYGIRAAHEEAPGMRLRAGKSYEIDIRSSGGLTIRPVELPQAL